jgi:hypothetical protein
MPIEQLGGHLTSAATGGADYRYVHNALLRLLRL